MTQQAKIRQMAKDHKLAQVNFLDKHGKIGARGKQVRFVEMQFSNGEWVKATLLEFIWLGKNVTFHLMAQEDWDKSGIKKPDGSTP